MINQRYLNDVLEYKNGSVFWKYDPFQRSQWNGQFSGKQAGSEKDRGYMQITFRPNARNGLVDTKYLLVHRIIFCMHYGYFPEFIDHINGDTKDNRIENLREATAPQNSANSKKPINNTSGQKGVSFVKRTGKYEVRVSFNKKRYAVGVFVKFCDAVKAYKEAEVKLQGRWRRTSDRAVIA